ncbi:MAG: hypothetical protein CMJ18_08115 [Phycisphaeraceae bacterium]|nr:hypothetical protein [Phycisphaeraceae bacterium]
MSIDMSGVVAASRRVKAVSVAAVSALLIAAAGPAYGNWLGGDGLQSWSDPANWTGNVVPGSNETAVVGDAAADRTIQNVSGQVGSLDWTQTTPGVTQTIVLSGFFDTRLGGVIFNGDGTNLIVDLNGNEWKRNEAVQHQFNDSATYISTLPGGIMGSDTIGVGANTTVGAGVIMQSASGGSTSRGTWHPTAVFRGTAPRFDLDQLQGSGLGTLLLGGPHYTGGTPQRMVFIENNGGFQQAPITGDVIMSTNTEFLFGPNTFPTNMIVGGNFTDPNTTGNYARTGTPMDDKIVFAMDPASTRTVSIGRSLGVQIWVGAGPAIHPSIPGSNGDIALGANLSTTGDVKVLGGSSMNVGTHTLSTGNVEFAGSLNLVLGPVSGQVDVTGTVALSGDLTLDASALTSYTDPIVLINNDGSDTLLGEFANAPPGTVFNTPAGGLALTYNHNGNDLALVIPEPSSLGLLMLAGAAAVRRRRR